MRFGFLVHPIQARDAARRLPALAALPEPWIEAALRRMAPRVAARTQTIRGAGGSEAEGVFIGVPLTPRMFRTLPEARIEEILVQAIEAARQEGCELAGLGAFTAVWKDGGETLARRTGFPITTGNTYTAAAALDAAFDACEKVGVEPARASAAVLGGTGSIGRVCAADLMGRFGRVVLIGRNRERACSAAAELGAEASIDPRDADSCDLIIAVTSSETPLIEPEGLRPGAIVVDVSRPRNASPRIARERPDILVIEGGVIEAPGRPDMGLNFGFPAGTAYACMAETMMMALEGRAESYSLGKSLDPARLAETRSLAAKHGFRLAGWRAFERLVPPEALARAREARR
jgi:predicted amino acid dehydrogenase